MQPLVWLPRPILDECRTDASEHYPNESGGSFMGYEADGQLVITSMVPGGKGALRTPCSYAPDTGWQNAEIAGRYQASGRKDSYLGDWHSHPDTMNAYLSRDDKAVIKKIIRCPAARASKPLMFVLCGSPASWTIHGWRGVLAKHARIFPYVRLTKVKISVC